MLKTNSLKNYLRELRIQKKAILAANFYNLETVQGILSAASELEMPVILQLSPSSISYIGLNTATALARSAITDFGVTGWLHLDHTSTLNLIREALDAGFDSVMIDASEKSFQENTSITREVVRLAEPYKVCVEAELGFVAKLGQSQDAEQFTQPYEAKCFVAETGIDSLAVAIGNAHGMYQGEPKIDPERLDEISRAADIPLVLHGSSGIPDHTISACIERGISKINFATEIKNMFMNSLRRELAKSGENDLRIVFPPAVSDVKNLVKAKIEVIYRNRE